MSAGRLALAIGITCASGCFELPSGGLCERDRDCGDTNACARTGQCASPGDLRVVVASWTLDGEAPSPSAPAGCSALSHMAVSFGEEDAPSRLTFDPVACDIGRLRVDKLPRWLDLLSVTAYGPDGDARARASKPLPEGAAADPAARELSVTVALEP